MSATAAALSGVYDADANHSSLEAGTRHMGVGSFRTRFEDITAHLTADETGLRLQGEAAVASISIRNPPEFRDHIVRGEDFFDADRFPVIRFASRNVALAEDGSAQLEGELTIKNVTKRVTAAGAWRPPTEDPYGSWRAALDFSTTIDRRDFGLNWQAQLPGGGDVLGWQVDIDVHLELVRSA